jgi:HK97 family phage prohead protease
MPDNFPFKASDESINSYGYWVLTSGIEIPSTGVVPVYYNHDTSGLPIGKAYNFKKDKQGNLTCDIELDEKDEFAMEVKDKIKGNYITGCSMGIIVKTTSNDTKFRKPNQTKETVIASRLVEVSVAPIPSNVNAIKLSAENGSDYVLNDLPPINTDMNFKEFIAKKGITLVQLGLKDDASEDEIVNAIKKLSDNPPKVDELPKNIDVKALLKEKGVSLAQLGLKDDAKDADIIEAIKKLAVDEQQPAPTVEEKLADKVVALGRLSGVVNDDNAEYFKKLAVADMEATSSLIEKLAATKKVEQEKKSTVDKAKLSELVEILKANAGEAGKSTEKAAPKNLSQRIIQRMQDKK